MLRRRDVDEFIELKRQGLSVRAISRLTGYGRTTISRYLSGPTSRPVYGPRTSAESICKGCCPHGRSPESRSSRAVPYSTRSFRTETARNGPCRKPHDLLENGLLLPSQDLFTWVLGFLLLAESSRRSCSPWLPQRTHILQCPLGPTSFRPGPNRCRMWRRRPQRQ